MNLGISNFLLPAIVFFVLFSTNSFNSALATDRQNNPNPQHLDGILPKEYDKLRVTPENSERLRTMHVNLYMGALKALIGQLGKKLYQQLNNGKTYVFLHSLFNFLLWDSDIKSTNIVLCRSSSLVRFDPIQSNPIRFESNPFYYFLKLILKFSAKSES